MKTRHVLVVATVLMMCLAPAVNTLLADDADAADNRFTNYYKDELTANQKIIYDALEGLDPSEVQKTRPYGQKTEDWVAEVSVPDDYHLQTTGQDNLRALVLQDMERAWQATMLDDPMQWWCWSTFKISSGDLSTGNAYLALYQKSFTLGGVEEVRGFTFFVCIDPQYAEGNDCSLAEKIEQTGKALKDLIDRKTIKGDSAIDIVRSINAYLVSDEFGYDSDNSYCISVYGALVNKTDGKYRVNCMGFSQIFRMLCNEYDVPCTGVVGIASQSGGNGGHMWNIVEVTADGKSSTLAVDTTFDATGNGKEAYLLNGSITKVDGATFTQTHQAFQPFGSQEWAEYLLTAPQIDSSGYEFPKDKDLMQMLQDYAPMLIVGLICLILVAVIVTTARRGE